MTHQKETRKEELHFDYKNIELLSEYINPHARMFNRRRTHLSARKQREFATAVKRARFMALTPFISQ